MADHRYLSRHGSARARCGRARELASLHVDGELSDVEERLLERHLAHCAACTAFDERLRATTELLRAAPFEEPDRSFRPPARVMPLPVRRRVVGVLVAAALGLGALLGTVRAPAGEPPAPESPQVSFLSNDVEQLRKIPRQTNLAPVPAPNRQNPPEGVI